MVGYFTSLMGIFIALIAISVAMTNNAMGTLSRKIEEHWEIYRNQSKYPNVTLTPYEPAKRDMEAMKCKLKSNGWMIFLLGVIGILFSLFGISIQSQITDSQWILFETLFILAIQLIIFSYSLKITLRTYDIEIMKPPVS